MGYPSDLSDEQWGLIKHHFGSKGHYRRSRHSKQHLISAVFYVAKTGCQWRQLPRDFPPWETVYTFYWRAKKKGTWKLVLRDLVGQSRKASGRDHDPTYSIIDSQSVKTTDHAEERGIDGGKKIKGRKRHVITDTQGHLLHVKVHAANIHDTVAGGHVFGEALREYPSLLGVCGDAGYRKTTKNYVTLVLGKTIEISERITEKWAVLAKRWVVERTFAWLNHCRRLAKDVEITISSAEHFVMIAHSMLLLKRLAKLTL